MLADGHEDGTFHDRFTLFDGDGGDGALEFRLDIVLHLHRLEDEYDVAYLDGITDIDFHVDDGTGQRCLHG